MLHQLHCSRCLHSSPRDPDFLPPFFSSIPATLLNIIRIRVHHLRASCSCKSFPTYRWPVIFKLIFRRDYVRQKQMQKRGYGDLSLSFQGLLLAMSATIDQRTCCPINPLCCRDHRTGSTGSSAGLVPFPGTCLFSCRCCSDLEERRSLLESPVRMGIMKMISSIGC